MRAGVVWMVLRGHLETVGEIDRNVEMTGVAGAFPNCRQSMSWQTEERWGV